MLLQHLGWKGNGWRLPVCVGITPVGSIKAPVSAKPVETQPVQMPQSSLPRPIAV
jgi:hypothetical protein